MGKLRARVHRELVLRGRVDHPGARTLGSSLVLGFQPLAYYANELRRRGWKEAVICLPHDGVA